MRRKLRGLEKSRQADERGGDVDAERYLVGPRQGGGTVEHRSEVPRAELPEEQERSADEAAVPQTRDDELLVGGDDRAAPVRIEEQQPVQGQARRHPSDHQLRQVSRQDEDHHARDRQRQIAEEHALATVPSEVVSAEVDDGRTEDRHKREHHCAEPIDADGEAKPAVAK